MPTYDSGSLKLYYDRYRITPPPVGPIEPDVLWSTRSSTMYKITDTNPTTKRVKPRGDAWTVFLSGTTRIRTRTSKYAKSVLNRQFRQEYVSGVKRRYDTCPDVHFQHGFAKLSDPVYTQIATQKAVCLNKAIAKARANSVNLGQMLAEYRQTASLFRSGSQLLVKATVAAVTRNPKLLLDRHSWSRKTSNAHLAYIYGVAPLVSDLHEAGSAIRTAGLRELFTSGSASTFLKTVRSANPSSIDLLTRQTNKLQISVTELRQLTVKTSFMVRLDSTLLLSSMGQYGLTNPLALAWELIPFSFVIDWWVNVGEVLSSLDNILYFGDARYQQACKFRFHQHCDFSGTPSDYMFEEYNRGPVSVMPAFASLQYKPSTSLRHVLAGLSLINVNRKKFGF